MEYCEHFKILILLPFCQFPHQFASAFQQMFCTVPQPPGGVRREAQWAYYMVHHKHTAGVTTQPQTEK